MFWLTNSKIVIQFERDFCRDSGTEKTMMMRRLLERLKASTTLRMKQALQIASHMRSKTVSPEAFYIRFSSPGQINNLSLFSKNTL